MNEVKLEHIVRDESPAIFSAQDCKSWIDVVQQSANRQEERRYPHPLQRLGGRGLPQYPRINVNDRRISPLFPAVLFDDGYGNSDHTNP